MIDPGVYRVPSRAPDPHRDVVAIVVTYQSPTVELRALITQLRAQTAAVIVVDNASSAVTLASIRVIANEAGGTLIELDANYGLAKAQNVGLREAERRGFSFALLSDDDSLPPDGMLQRLCQTFAEQSTGGHKIAAVGPLVHDARISQSTLVFRDTFFGPRRQVMTNATAPVPVPFLIASGCLVSLDVVREIGPMREDLFIDHVDLEWCLRARRHEYTLICEPRTLLPHHLGDKLRRVWYFGWRNVHLHSPLRNYYLVRNTLLLVRSRLLPLGWKAGYLAWLTRFCLFNAVAVAPRRERVKMITRALRDGILNRSGCLPVHVSPEQR